MAPRPQLRVLFFDVFGTCVEQGNSVAEELSRAAKAALESNPSSISTDVRKRATEMSYEQWFDFGGEWNKYVGKFVQNSIAETDNVDWRIVDQYRINSLQTLLARRGLIVQRADVGNSKPQVEQGSLWDEAQLEHLGRVWHRLKPQPDTCRGLDLLNNKFFTVTLSNTYNEVTESIAAHSNIPFTHIFTSDLFQSYKPNRKVYLGAVEKMGVKPEECALVAAHLYDLKAAKACGFYAIYVDRPLEEKNPELREEGIPDMWVGQDENGLVTIAERLGAQVD